MSVQNINLQGWGFAFIKFLLNAYKADTKVLNAPEYSATEWWQDWIAIDLSQEISELSFSTSVSVHKRNYSFLHRCP